jgi:predicted AlkP superfamily pyrophosphatase or phosphodiesterase
MSIYGPPAGNVVLEGSAMKSTVELWLLVITLACLAGCSVSRPDRVSRTVILVSVDGLAASYLRDPAADMPNLRLLAMHGAHARGMLASCPSVTWPSHITMVTGVHPARHGVISNAVLNRSTGKIVTYIGDRELTKQQAVRAPTLYDAAHHAGLRTAAIIWPACNGADTLNWMIPDANRREVHEQWTTPGLTEELEAAGVPIRELQGWGWNKQYSEQRDDAYVQIVEYLLDRHQPDLILVHLITPDGVQHAYGPQTPQAYEAVANADARIGRLWAALQKPPHAGRSTLLVVSDHGFAPYDKLIKPNVVLKRLGLLNDDAWKEPLKQRAIVKEAGGTAFVYILDEDNRQEIASLLRAELAKLEGVDAVIPTPRLVKLGLPHPDANPEAPHLLLSCGRGYLFQDKLDGEAIEAVGETRGAHGHLPDRPWMHAMFVAAGAGIRPGAMLDTAHSRDIAPTIARLLGFPLHGADGRPLDSILAR